MTQTVLSWNAGALACYEAVRGRLLYDGNIYLSDLVSALAIDTLPNQSVLGRILRDTTIWPDGSSLVRAASRSAGYQEANPHLDRRLDSFENFAGFAFAVERLAKAEGSRTVGERHIAQRIVEIDGGNHRFAFMSLNTQQVCDEVRLLEIGPEFTDQELGGWHGLIDTNIVLKSKNKFWDIPWRSITGVPLDTPWSTVTIWLSTVLLHELDAIPTYHRDPDIKRKASAFTGWLNTKLKTAKDVHQEVWLGEGVRLKFWRVPVSDLPPDSQHLEAALSLRDRGIEVRVITHDSEMRVRALAEGFEIFDLPPDLLMHP